MEQKLDYLHNNPVATGIVYEPEHYVYSSAISYAGQQRLIDVLLMEQGGLEILSSKDLIANPDQQKVWIANPDQ